jgi:hypothetical protein
MTHSIRLESVVPGTSDVGPAVRLVGSPEAVADGPPGEGPAAARAELAPLRTGTTELGFRVACYAIPVTAVPADFFADPDGQWTFEALAQAAGFAIHEGVAIGALREPFNGHPDGAAVVTLNAEARPYVAIIECPIAFVYADGALERVSAA